MSDHHESTIDPDACPACGAEAIPGTRYCRRCGSPLAGHDRTEVAEVGQDTDRHRAVVVAPSGGRTPDPPGLPDSPDAVLCPTCGVANVAERELCGRCGADLETGEIPPRPRPPSLTRPPEPAEDAPMISRRWWIAVVVIVVVVASIVGVFAYAEVGWFAATPDVPPVSFGATGYGDDDVVALPLSDVATLTTRAPDGDRSFTPAQMVDQNTATAWHSDGSELPAGVGEIIDLFLDQPAWVTEVVLNNGDHADSQAYEATARIQRAQLIFDGGTTLVVRFLDQGRRPQVVELPEPELTTAVRIEILQTVAGSSREDVAVSGLGLRGWVADDADRQLAEDRAAIKPAAGALLLPNG